MTGFATASVNSGKYTLSVLIRAVNHRFFDVAIRMPDTLRPLEPVLREKMAFGVKRGKIDCQIQCAERADTSAALGVHEPTVKALLSAEKQIIAMSPDAHPLTVSEILRHPGVLMSVSEEVEAEELKTALQTAFDRAWNEFMSSRKREGEKLHAILARHADQMESLALQCKPRMPIVYQAYKERLIKWVKDSGAELDESRLMQEVALYAARIDVQEEIDRLLAHINEIRRILKSALDATVPNSADNKSQNESYGKRLDFLAQELHREANTLGSKSVDLTLSQISLELKVLIEQLREQVQNIE
ncbi:MAG: YicC family protein [Burkholderiales bacterium]|nr:YicC family protein [Burkholderiales bacterium]